MSLRLLTARCFLEGVAQVFVEFLGGGAGAHPVLAIDNPALPVENHECGKLSHAEQFIQALRVGRRHGRLRPAPGLTVS